MDKFPSLLIFLLISSLLSHFWYVIWDSPREPTNCNRAPCAVGSNEAPNDASVFVTFAVDGDKAGTLSSHDGLWPRIAGSHLKSRHGRIAVTPKVPNTDSVCWNYHRFVRLPLWLIQKYNHRVSGLFIFPCLFYSKSCQRVFSITSIGKIDHFNLSFLRTFEQRC